VPRPKRATASFESRAIRAISTRKNKNARRGAFVLEVSLTHRIYVASIPHRTVVCMSKSLLALLVLVLFVFFVIIAQDRAQKRRHRSCRRCGCVWVTRIFKMFQIISDKEVKGFEHHAPPGMFPFAVYKFYRCPHCGHCGLHESYDKDFSFHQIARRSRNMPGAFVYDATLFRDAGLKPCQFIKLEFDLGELSDQGSVSRSDPSSMPEEAS